MTENEITGDILDSAIKVHRKFGPGMLESVYERLLEAELLKRGHSVERQKSVSFEYEGMTLEDAFKVDLINLNNLCALCLSAPLRETKRQNTKSTIKGIT